MQNNGLIIYAQNDKQITDAINEIAPEHLELNIINYKKYLGKIYNAGSICVGKYSPMAVTDYNVGTNHVLPTLGSAKFSSGLGVIDFMKKNSVKHFPADGEASLSGVIVDCDIDTGLANKIESYIFGGQLKNT